MHDDDRAAIRWHLDQVRAQAFGRFSGREFGPFSPGLTVVCGPNESGKTTLAQLIRGVLFGWQQARGKKNPYRPAAGDRSERAGSLVFAREGSTPHVIARDARRTPDPQDPVLEGIDPQTFDTLFNLTSDELMGLDAGSDLMARLLSASSGTASSPAKALKELDDRIRSLTTKSASESGSVPNLRAQMNQLIQRQRVLEDETRQIYAQRDRLSDLVPQQESLASDQERLDEIIGTLRTRLAQIETFDARLHAARQKVAETQAQVDACEAEAGQLNCVLMTDADVAAVRPQLESMQEQRDAKHRAALAAQHALERSREELAHAEALEADAESSSWRRRQRRVRLGCAVLVTLMLVAFGVFVAFQGWERNSLTYLGIGVLVVGGALVLGAGAASVFMRPSKEEELLVDARKKAAWVVQQDEKTLDQARQDVVDHDQHVAAFLESHGLPVTPAPSAALDQALAALHQSDLAQGQQSQVAHRLSFLRETLRTQRGEVAQLAQERAQVCEQAGVSDDQALADLQEQLSRHRERRSQIRALSDQVNREYGQISQQLADAGNDEAFDRVKLEVEQARTRLDDATLELAKLLLARHALERALQAWGGQTQPQTYACASRLFEQMTHGRWVEVLPAPNGQVLAVSSTHEQLEPHLLSLGTRQQLYLALRLALLMTASDLAPSLPVLADDILVNFDEERRRGAALALGELARVRQAIVFTCHKETARLLQETVAGCRFIEL